MFKEPAGNLPSLLRNKAERAAFLALAGSVGMSLISIAASEILLFAAALFCAFVYGQQAGPVPPGKKILLPLFAFMAWTLIAAMASSNVLPGLTAAKKFYLLLLVPMVPLILRKEGRVLRIYMSVFAAALIASLYGLVQFAADPHRDLLHRISGFSSQWMTYSGLLMLALAMLASYALCLGVRRRLWIVPTAAAVLLALLCSQTRSTAMGAMVGVAVVILIRKPRSIAALIAALLIFYLLAPSGIQERFKSGLNPEDPNTRNRIELFQTAVRLIRHHPWLGVGPQNVKVEALKYRGSDSAQYPDWMYQHMHNNFLQIASATGLPGLAIWLWFMTRLAWDALGTYRSALRRTLYPTGEEHRKEALMASSAALGALAALMVAGLFEYNFGDSEVLILFLFIVSAPYSFPTFERGRVP